MTPFITPPPPLPLTTSIYDCSPLCNETHVLSDLSCASSKTMTENFRISGSDKHSLSRHPSVKYPIRVLLDVRSSNRTAYPTSSPTLTPISHATRLGLSPGGKEGGGEGEKGGTFWKCVGHMCVWRIVRVLPLIVSAFGNYKHAFYVCFTSTE